MFLRVYEWLGKMEMTIAKVCLFTLTALVFLSAVARSLHHPMSWTVDMATFLFAWCVFLAADAAMRKDTLVCIDVIVSHLPPNTQRIIKIINNIIVTVFLAIMVGFGVYLCFTTYHRSFAGLPWLSYTWVTLSVPLGCLLMLITNLLKTKALLIEGRAAQ